MEKRNLLRHDKAASQKSLSIRAKKVSSKHSVGSNGVDVVNQSHVSLLNERYHLVLMKCFGAEEINVSYYDYLFD